LKAERAVGKVVHDAGITSIGAYLPRSRLKRSTIAAATAWANPSALRAEGERTVAAWDEDSITMAVAAARDCVPQEQRSRLEALWLVSTTLPFADRDNAVLVAEALDLPNGVRTLTVAGSRRGATSALIAACSQPGDQLLVAADRRAAMPGSDQELRQGHAGVALRVGVDGVLAQFIGSASLAADLVDSYRESGSAFDYALEERWVRDEGYFKLVPETVQQALQKAGLQGSDVAHVIFPGSATVARKLVQMCGLTGARIADSLDSNCGETGAPHVLLMLAKALEEADAEQTVLVIGFGQGVDAVLLRTTQGNKTARASRVVSRELARGTDEPQYLRYLSGSGAIDMDWGMRAERDNRTAQSVAYRRRDELTGFIGGRCKTCGTVQFPRARVCVNPECRATDTLEAHPLANTRGRVKSFTEDWLAYSQRPPLIYGNVELEGGGNLMMEFTDLQAGELKVGDVVAMEFRIKDLDRLRGFRRYFWKAIRA